MGLELKCSNLEQELGMEGTCPFVAHGADMGELMADMNKHAKEVHGYTDEQLEDPETIALMQKHTASIE